MIWVMDAKDKMILHHTNLCILRVRMKSTDMKGGAPKLFLETLFSAWNIIQGPPKKTTLLHWTLILVLLSHPSRITILSIGSIIIMMCMGDYTTKSTLLIRVLILHNFEYQKRFTSLHRCKVQKWKKSWFTPCVSQSSYLSLQFSSQAQKGGIDYHFS
jgi:hypothetical protein